MVRPKISDPVISGSGFTGTGRLELHESVRHPWYHQVTRIRHHKLKAFRILNRSWYTYLYIKSYVFTNIKIIIALTVFQCCSMSHGHGTRHRAFSPAHVWSPHHASYIMYCRCFFLSICILPCVAGCCVIRCMAYKIYFTNSVYLFWIFSIWAFIYFVSLGWGSH